MLWQTTKRSQRPMPRGFARLHSDGLPAGAPRIAGLHLAGRPAGGVLAPEGNEGTTGRVRA